MASHLADIIAKSKAKVRKAEQKIKNLELKKKRLQNKFKQEVRNASAANTMIPFLPPNKGRTPILGGIRKRRAQSI